MTEESAGDVALAEKGQQSATKPDESSVRMEEKSEEEKLHRCKKREITQLTLKSNQIEDLLG